MEEMSEEEGDIKERENNVYYLVIPIPKEEWNEFCKPWKLLKLLGKSIGYCFLKARIEKFWQRKGKIKFIDIGNGYFLI